MSLAETILVNRECVIGHNVPPSTAEILADRHSELLGEIKPLTERAASLPKKVTDDLVLGRLGAVVVDAKKLLKKVEGKRTEEVQPHLTGQRGTNGFFNTYKEQLKRIFEPLEDLATDYQNAKAAEAKRKLDEEARKARVEQDRLREAAEAAAASGRQTMAARHEDRAEEAGGRGARMEAASGAKAAELTRVRTDTGLVSSRQAWKFTINDLSLVPLDVLRPYIAADAIEKAIGKNVGIHKGVGKLAGVTIFQDTKASFR